jgi:hypothetical protein
MHRQSLTVSSRNTPQEHIDPVTTLPGLCREDTIDVGTGRICSRCVVTAIEVVYPRTREPHARVRGRISFQRLSRLQSGSPVSTCSTLLVCRQKEILYNRSKTPTKAEVKDTSRHGFEPWTFRLTV